MNEMIRRAAPGLALAGAALSVVWLFDPAFDAGAGSTASAAPASGTQADDATGADSGSSTDSGASAGSESSSAASDDCSNPTTVTGDPVAIQWGTVQVRMAFAADGTVCSVEAIAYPEGDPHSARINAIAIPQLDAQAAEVGVQFDAVSGATFTSEAYRESMQSILDKR